MNRLVRSWISLSGMARLGMLAAVLLAAMLFEPSVVSAQVTVMSRQDGSEVRVAGPDIAMAGAKMAVSVGGEMERIVKNAPFSATSSTTTTQVLGDGNRIQQTSEMVLARDAEGRTRREMSVDKLGPWSTDTNGRIVFIRDPVAMVIYELAPDGQHASKRTLFLPTADDHVKLARREADMKARTRVLADQVHHGEQGTVVARTEARGAVGVAGQPFEFSTMIIGPDDAGAVKKEALGEQMMEGVRVQGTRETRTIAAGKIGNERPIEIVSETWYSPDLQLVVQSRHSDPRVGETIYRLSNIMLAEPDPSQFQVPPGVTVRDEKDFVNTIRIRSDKQPDQPQQ